MVALLGIAACVAVVLTAAGIVGRLMVTGLWTLVAFGFLFWLAVSPEPRLFPAAWWLLAAWLGAWLVRATLWFRRRSGDTNRFSR